MERVPHKVRGGDLLLLLAEDVEKSNKLGSYVEGIKDIVYGSSMMSLVGISYDYVDRGLLLAFVERFHFETKSFHLLVGEMSVTLDDMSPLLYLP